MILRIKCGTCGRSVRLAEEKIPERAVRFFCKNCGAEVRLSRQEGQIRVAGAAVDRAPEEALPDRIGDYAVLKLLGSGGMGDVYLARQSGAEGFEREVVIKSLHPGMARDERFAQAMIDEAKLTVQLHHPNIVQLHTLQRTEDRLYLVMEYVDGKSVASIQAAFQAKRGLIPAPMAVHIASQALLGLEYAHQKKNEKGQPLNLVHRDISPQNILVSRQGWVKIIDFGIAKAVGRASHTRPGTLRGKFAYMAPEQFAGGVDHRSDLFSMGVVLWEMLAGARLFVHRSREITAQRVLHMPVPRLSRRRRDVPRKLDRALKKALARDPKKRYQSAGEFAAGLIGAMAPMTQDQLRASVDIDASRLGDGSQPPLSEELLFDDIPSGPEEGAKAIGELAPPGARRPLRIKPLLWALVVFLLGAGAGSGLYWYLAPAAPEAPADAGPDAGAEPLEIADGGDREPSGPGDPDRDLPPTRPPPLGRLTGKTIRKVMRRHGAELQGCAESHLAAEEAGQSIKLTLRFQVGGDGQVGEVEILPKEIESTEFGKCLMTRMAPIRFPRHRDPSVTISFPLEFQPTHPGGSLDK